MNHSPKFDSKKASQPPQNERNPDFVATRDESKTCLPETVIMCNVADPLLNMFSFGGKL